MSNYGVLGLTSRKPIEDGWHKITIKKIEPAETNFPADLSIKITYEMEGREFQMYMRGNYSKENGMIVGAGGTYPILDLFDALGIIGVKSDGTLNMEELEKFNKTEHKEPQVIGYVYRTIGNDGRTYIRVYKSMLPANADGRRKAYVEKRFQADVGSGFIKLADNVVKNETLELDESDMGELEEAPF